MPEAFGLSQYSGEGVVDDVDLAAGLPDASFAARRGAESVWTVEAITTYQAFLDLQPIWDRLLAESNATHPFTGHEWVRAWWDAFGAEQQLNILLVRANDQPIAIVPLMSCTRRLCGVPVRQVQFIWNVYVERFDFIVGRWPQAAYRAALNYLSGRAKDWDLMLLHQLPANSPSLTELRRLGAEQAMRVESLKSSDSPYLPICGAWETYHAGLDSKHRSNLRNRHKRLNQLGSVALEIITTPKDVPQALEDGFSLEAAGWKGRAGSAIGCCPQSRRYYTQLAQAAAERGLLRICFLTLNGARIAFGYFIEQNNKLYLLKPGYDPRYASYSPSNLLCDLVLRDAFDRRVSEIDFLGFADPWKLQWTKDLRSHYWLYLFPNRLKPRVVHWMRFRLQPALGQVQFIRTVRKAVLVATQNACWRKVAPKLRSRGK